MPRRSLRDSFESHLVEGKMPVPTNGVEEAANRTKLAPKKKKETYKEAIELYKKALSLGKTEAQAKIDALNKKI